MIPSEVAEIAGLIFADWTETDDLTCNEVLEAAWRIHHAGFRKPKPAEDGGIAT